MTDILFLIIVFSLTIVFYYLILLIPIRLIIKKKKRIKILVAISVTLGSATAGWIVFSSPAYNENQVKIVEHADNEGTIIIKGERVPLPHSVSEIFFRQTYSDSLVLEVPRIKGRIEGLEIIRASGYSYTGSVQINSDQVIIDLYYNNTDDSIQDPLSWNGTYEYEIVGRVSEIL